MQPFCDKRLPAHAFGGGPRRLRSEGQRGKTARPKKRHRGRDREVRIWKQNTEASGHRKPGRSNDLLLVQSRGVFRP